MIGEARWRILLADDHSVVRHGLRMLLDAQPDLHVVLEAGDGIEAVRAALRQEIDLAILDITMPRMTGLHAARELRRLRPELRILILSMHENERYRYEALDAGASGYVVKAAADRDLVDACRAVLRGERFVRAGTMTPLIERTKDLPRADDPLTPREQQVVKLVAEGYSSKEIAAVLVISNKTVERHRANILQKLNIAGRVELTRYAIRRGLIEP
jgi:DNA-binding NarL/FixJ family response regulator